VNQDDLDALNHVGEDIEQEGLIPVNQTDDPLIVPRNFATIIQSVMNEAQWMVLAGRTPKHLIKKRPGKGGKTFSYVPHGYVTATLNRCFGFDWDFELLPWGDGDYFQYREAVMGEDYKGDELELRPASVLVHGKLTVRVRDPGDPTRVIAPISKSAIGEKEAIRGMTWGGLVKSAASDALKKASSLLGVALDLYWQDMDEDYLVDFVGEVDVRGKEMRGFVEGAVTLEDDEVARELQKRFSASYPEIAKLLGVTVPEVIEWCNEGEE